MNTSYKIIFNSRCAERTPLVYSYGNTKDIRISLAKNKAVVSFTMGVKKTIDDFARLKVNIFADAYRKVLLCHACKYGCNLQVEKITTCIDDDEYELNEDNTDAFPLMYSMISSDSFNISEAFGSGGFLNEIVSTTKSDAETDLRFVSLYSYLQSKKRNYIIDRFSNLWTSMNAFYNYYYKMTEQYKKDPRPKDKAALDNIIKILGFGGCISSQNEREQNKQFYHKMKDLLSGMKNDKELYDSAFSKRKDIRFEKLQECAGELKMDLFPLLLFEFPYYLRCNYFHGNQCTILISSYNDYELRCLETVNYFLDRFLDERIPMLFAINEEAAK